MTQIGTPPPGIRTAQSDESTQPSQIGDRAPGNKPEWREATSPERSYSELGGDWQSAPGYMLKKIALAVRKDMISEPKVGGEPKYAGELKDISPNPTQSIGRPGVAPKPGDHQDVVVLLDSGLQATVDENGVHFDELNTAEGGTIAAWYSRPIGEIAFESLQTGSIGPGQGGYAERIGNPDEGPVDIDTQFATVALYKALKDADRGNLSDAQLKNIDATLAKLQPYISIPARGENIGSGPWLDNIQQNEQGVIELDYRGADGKTAVNMSGDAITVEYFESPQTRGDAFGYGISDPIVSVSETLDLTDTNSWTPRQRRLGAELKAALSNTDTAVLTNDELIAHKSILSALNDVPTMSASEHADVSV